MNTALPVHIIHPESECEHSFTGTYNSPRVSSLPESHGQLLSEDIIILIIFAFIGIVSTMHWNCMKETIA